MVFFHSLDFLHHHHHDPSATLFHLFFIFSLNSRRRRLIDYLLICLKPINSLSAVRSRHATFSRIEPPTTNEQHKHHFFTHKHTQILERHLVLNRKISKHELNQLDSIQTSGATLRLIDAHQHQQQQEQPVTGKCFENAWASYWHAMSCRSLSRCVRIIDGRKWSSSSSRSNQLALIMMSWCEWESLTIRARFPFLWSMMSEFH